MTELSVSAIGVGTWRFSGVWGKQIEQPEVNAILSRSREKAFSMSPAMWVNAWCLKQSRVATVILGIKTLIQLETNALADSISL